MPEIVFKGKEFVYNHHLTVPYRPLVVQADKGVGAPDLSGNLVIHGDNLAALKSLLPRYAGKVDLIFIDPPYNTGNEGWCYSDGVNSPIMREWLSSNPVDGDDMLRHDKWLCMMWPRLTLLRELLSERGSLWMTLDDNEVHRARMVMDELFGDENVIGMLAWEKVYSPRMDSTGLSKDIDSVLAYAKSKPDLRLTAQLAEQTDRAFTYTEPETGKRARLRTLRKEGSESLRADRENCWYPIDAPDGSKIWPIKPDGSQGRWRWERSTFQLESAKCPSRVHFAKNEADQFEVMVKQYFEGEAEQPLSTLLRHEAFGHTHEAAEEIKQIFGRKTFDTPKPTRLVEGIINICCASDSLILDSFAGSGTTAHAVLKANAKDNGNRHFILVEGEAYADALTAERVRRAINGYAWVGTQRETLLEQKITFTQLKKADALLAQVEAVKAREGFTEGDLADQGSASARRFDSIEAKVDDGVLRVEGVRRISERAPGLGGSFTYCTLGEPLDLEKMLSGERLPPVDALGEWLFHTATGGTLAAAPSEAPAWYLGEAQDKHVWLVYRPDLAFLKSPEAALTLSLAQRIAAWGQAADARSGQRKGHLVFAPAKYLSNLQLRQQGVDFAPLPFALYREG